MLARRLLFIVAWLFLCVWVLVLPFPWGILWAIALICYVGFGIWSMYPRPCEVCGAGQARPFPLPGYQTGPWWDLRFPRRRDYAWLCHSHFLSWLIMRATLSAGAAGTPESD